MAGFDENEAEELASNWVQNLKFRFARMGLNYDSDAGKYLENECDYLTSQGKVVSCGLPVANFKSKPLYPDLLHDINNESLSGDQDVLTGARSERSPVDLKDLREKRLHFFEVEKSSNTFHNNKTSNCCNIIDKPIKLQNPNESGDFQNDIFDTKVTSVEGCGVYNIPMSTNKLQSVNVNTKLNSEAFGTRSSKRSDVKSAWECSNINTIDSLNLDVVPKCGGSHKLLKLDLLSLDDSLPTNESHNSFTNNSIENCRNSAKSYNGFVSVNTNQINDLTNSSKDSTHVFPLELGKDDLDLRVSHSNAQPQILTGRVVCDSDSDSDFTLDDPISRHTSPRVEESPLWELLRRNSGAISPLVLSVSPPAPQITGALYHEFSCSNKEVDCELSNSVACNSNDYEQVICRRPRSLSHPSSARDCSELCMSSSYGCCCAKPNDGDVVCDVLSRNGRVDIQIKCGNSKSDGMSNGWFNGSENSFLKDGQSINNQELSPNANLLDENDEGQNKVHASLANTKADLPFYGSLLSKDTNTIDEHFFDACLCPECSEINRTTSHWCLECGAILSSTKPLSGKSVNLCNESVQAGKHQVPNEDVTMGKKNHSEKTNALRQSSLTKKVTKDKFEANGLRWEKSNLAWNTFRDSHLSKPPSTKKIKGHLKKQAFVKESAVVSRPRSSSYKKLGNRLDVEKRGFDAGSLPKSYKFTEFEKKRGEYVDHSIDSLKLKGVKATEKKAVKTLADCTQYDEMTAMIQANRDKPLPYLCLPDEIILTILCHLSHADIARCACVCRQLQRISQDEILWRTIVLTRNQNISDDFLEKIGSKRPVSLSLIKCRGNSVTSNGLRELFRRCAESLEELNFIGCNGGLLIGESILLHVALRCKKVRSVDASWSNVGDNGVEALVDNVERLVCLCLNGCQAITDRSLKVVGDKHGHSLRTFEIFGCFNVSAVAIKRLGQSCPNLETLNLGQCYKITSSDIGKLVSHLQSIVNLDLRGCKQARDACVRTIVKHCPLLVNLVLANCPLITDVAMSAIAANLSDVRCLDVCGCVKVTDHGVRALARSCNRLNSLDLSSTSITQKSVMLLANYCSQNLQSLKLSFCVDVTDDSVSRLVRHCKRMKTLHLYGCKRLRNLKALQQLNRSLKLEF